MDQMVIFVRLFLGMGIIWYFEILAFALANEKIHPNVFIFTDTLNMCQVTFWKLLKTSFGSGCLGLCHLCVQAECVRSDVRTSQRTLQHRQIHLQTDVRWIFVLRRWFCATAYFTGQSSRAPTTSVRGKLKKGLSNTSTCATREISLSTSGVAEAHQMSTFKWFWHPSSNSFDFVHSTLPTTFHITFHITFHTFEFIKCNDKSIFHKYTIWLVSSCI